jgi:protein-L-isoaspartate(D-aspartate) O-methyltransferase
MDPTRTDFARARLNMIEGQLRPNRVTDPALLAAMAEVPREAFLPPALRPLAYIDEDIPLAGGRALMEPMVFARLVQEARVRAGSKVLVVAAGAGYGAAVLARMGARVVALEAPGPAAEALRASPAAGAAGVVIAIGPLAEGWAAEAPYDVVLIEGAVEEIPPALPGQLAEGGRLVTVRASGRPGVLGRAVRLLRLAGTVTEVPLFDAGTPLLPEFRRAPAFVF